MRALRVMKIAEIVTETLKGHNATGSLVEAMILATTKAQGSYFTKRELEDIRSIVFKNLKGDFNPFADTNVF